MGAEAGPAPTAGRGALGWRVMRAPHERRCPGSRCTAKRRRCRAPDSHSYGIAGRGLGLAVVVAQF